MAHPRIAAPSSPSSRCKTLQCPSRPACKMTPPRSNTAGNLLLGGLWPKNQHNWTCSTEAGGAGIGENRFFFIVVLLRFTGCLGCVTRGYQWWYRIHWLMRGRRGAVGHAGENCLHGCFPSGSTDRSRLLRPLITITTTDAGGTGRSLKLGSRLLPCIAILTCMGIYFGCFIGIDIFVFKPNVS